MSRIFYDFHIHSCLSPCGDNDMTPANIAGMAFVNGLQAIALTDHNTTKNCEALKAAAEQYKITVLFGMELTTCEEVHVVCLFPNKNCAQKFDKIVSQNLIKIKNDPEIFGHQYIMDSRDKILGEEENLLINATTIDFDSVFDIVKNCGGVAYPAHIDKNSNSVISNLGFIPPESKFKTAELNNTSNKKRLISEYPHLSDCIILTDSDAHYLENINTAENFLEVDDPSPGGIIEFLRNE